MPTSTVENYVKQIYLEQQQTPGELVSMGKLAAAMRVVPGTATTMIKALSDSGLVDYEPRGGARLTRGGEQLALHVLRRHRLVELFLVKILGWIGRRFMSRRRSWSTRSATRSSTDRHDSGTPQRRSAWRPDSDRQRKDARHRTKTCQILSRERPCESRG